MNCDMNLVRNILLQIESQESGYAPVGFVMDGYSQEQIHYHSYIMIQGGLIEGIIYTNFSSQSPQAIPKNLTWAGHEFIKTARSDTLWKKAMDTVITCFCIWLRTASSIPAKLFNCSGAFSWVS